MKKSVSMLSACLFLCAGSLLGAENLIPNGDFNKFDKKSGKALSWNCGRHAQVVEEGPKATPVLRLCSYYKSGKFWKSNTSVTIPQIRKGTYKFSVKSKGTASMFYMFLVPGKGEKGQRFIRNFTKLKMKPLSDKWVQGEYVLTIPADMKNAQVILEFFCAKKGEYEFLDDVSFVKIK